MPHPWDPDFVERSPLFEPLRAAMSELRTPHWPDCNDLNRAIAACGRSISTGDGRLLRYVEQQLRQSSFEDKYELRIYLRGEVQFRPCNWHDLFNALVWLTFPAAKAALNRRHYAELQSSRANGKPNRGAVQDTLTLFDEGGLIVASDDAALTALLTGHRWKDLFWQRRTEVARTMRFYLFGHALYEKALQPFVGVSGRAAIFEVESAFFDAPLSAQLGELDLRLSSRLGDVQRFAAPCDLAPIPILGIPGWFEGNAVEHFYDNTDYFRPLQRR